MNVATEQLGGTSSIYVPSGYHFVAYYDIFRERLVARTVGIPDKLLTIFSEFQVTS